MAPWQNDDLILYHGCTDQSLRSKSPTGILVDQLPHGIDITVGGQRKEFGRGFYTTTSFAQARSWANIRARKSHGRSNAVVLTIAISRDQLADLQALVFLNEGGDYWHFVSYCRSGATPHGRARARQMEYDVVYGPVSVADQEFIMKDCDQISFHTQKALTIIPVVRIAAMGGPLLV